MTTMDKTTEGLGLNVRDLISATLTGRAMSTGLLTAQETKEVEGTKKRISSWKRWGLSRFTPSFPSQDCFRNPYEDENV